MKTFHDTNKSLHNFCASSPHYYPLAKNLALYDIFVKNAAPSLLLFKPFIKTFGISREAVLLIEASNNGSYQLLRQKSNKDMILLFFQNAARYSQKLKPLIGDLKEAKVFYKPRSNIMQRSSYKPIYLKRPMNDKAKALLKDLELLCKS